jgi:NADPH:quinone reductase-like Zn-dependent oxidoreductase
MRAVSLPTFGGPEVLELIETDLPDPAPGQVLVRVRAIGVNPADWKLRSGLSRRFKPPYIPGFDLSGDVVATGGQVTQFSPGDAVYGALVPPGGAYAEYAAAPEDLLAPVPAGLDHAHAAALPTAALTAWQPLVRVADVRAGQQVLIHAAAGGVGHLAVQIAKAHGAYVIGTARQDRHAFLRALGADELIDYTAADFAAQVRNVDIVLDPISGEYGVRSLDTLAPGGILIDITGPGPERGAIRERSAARGLRYTEFTYRPSGADLEEISALVRGGALQVLVDRTLPLESAAAAHELSETGHVKGKIVLTP